MLATRSLSLLGLLKLLEKTATCLKFVHFIRTECVCETFFTHVTWSRGLLIKLRHFKISTLVCTENRSHWTSMLQMVDQVVERNFLPETAPIYASENETSLHFVFILLGNFD